MLKSMEPLLKLALGGDRLAENEIFQQLSVRFTLIARHHLGGSVSADAAADAAQSACVIVLEKYRSATFTTSFESWSYGVLMNVIRRAREKKGYEERIMVSDIGEDLPDRAASNPMVRLRLESCLRDISVRFPTYMAILNLVLEGYSRAEIAQRTGIKPDTLNTYFSRGRQLLIACMERKKHANG